MFGMVNTSHGLFQALLALVFKSAAASTPPGTQWVLLLDLFLVLTPIPSWDGSLSSLGPWRVSTSLLPGPLV